MANLRLGPTVRLNGLAGARTPSPSISRNPPTTSPTWRATPEGACNIRPANCTSPLKGWTIPSRNASARSAFRSGSGSGFHTGGVRTCVSGEKS